MTALRDDVIVSNVASITSAIAQRIKKLGIVLPKDVKNITYLTWQGDVVSVGKQNRYVRVGDTVIFGGVYGVRIERDGKEYLVLEGHEVIAGIWNQN